MDRANDYSPVPSWERPEGDEDSENIPMDGCWDDNTTIRNHLEWDNLNRENPE